MLNGEQVLNELSKEKDRTSIPILSEDQKKVFEKKIVEYFFLKEEVIIKYYESGYIKTLTAYIVKLDSIKGIIYLSNNMHLHFSNILDILSKNT